jgi:hypothetical protein
MEKQVVSTMRWFWLVVAGHRHFFCRDVDRVLVVGCVFLAKND